MSREQSDKESEERLVRLQDLRQAYADVLEDCRRRAEADEAEIARLEESNTMLLQASKTLYVQSEVQPNVKEKLKTLLMELQIASDQLDGVVPKARVHLVTSTPSEDDLFYTREAHLARTALNELKEEKEILADMIAQFPRISGEKLAKLQHDLSRLE